MNTCLHLCIFTDASENEIIDLRFTRTSVKNGKWKKKKLHKKTEWRGDEIHKVTHRDACLRAIVNKPACDKSIFIGSSEMDPLNKFIMVTLCQTIISLVNTVPGLERYLAR